MKINVDVTGCPPLFQVQDYPCRMGVPVKNSLTIQCLISDLDSVIFIDLLYKTETIFDNLAVKNCVTSSAAV